MKLRLLICHIFVTTKFTFPPAVYKGLCPTPILCPLPYSLLAFLITMLKGERWNLNVVLIVFL